MPDKGKDDRFFSELTVPALLRRLMIFWNAAKGVFTTAISTIEEDHNAIHKGEGFNTNLNLISDENLAPGETVWVNAATTDFFVHLKTRQVKFDLSTIKITVWEGTEFDETTAGETPSYAMNRNNIKEPVLHIYNPNIVPDTTNAEIINQFRLKGIEELPGNKFIGNLASADNNLEYIYQPNQKYALEIENIGNGTLTFMNIYWFWYVSGRD